ncbi:unnamed protein product, partial [marine sediment metagenome]
LEPAERCFWFNAVSESAILEKLELKSFSAHMSFDDLKKKKSVLWGLVLIVNLTIAVLRQVVFGSIPFICVKLVCAIIVLNPTNLNPGNATLFIIASIV